MMLSIVIPTYNERENIAPLVTRLDNCLKDYEIIFVDDNSPDGTADEIRSLSGKYPVRVIGRKGKLGLTSAVVEGALAAKGGNVLVMDADLSHPPESAPLLSSALSSSDLVIGSRLAKGGGVENWPFHRKIISSVAEWLARLILGVRTTDPLSGFFAARKALFTKTRFRTKGYKLLLNMLADNPGIRISEVPYVFKDRYAGKTKLGALEIFNYLLDLLRIRFGHRTA